LQDDLVLWVVVAGSARAKWWRAAVILFVEIASQMNRLIDELKHHKKGLFATKASPSRTEENTNCDTTETPGGSCSAVWQSLSSPAPRLTSFERRFPERV
jgi:hypothetical protein